MQNLKGPMSLRFPLVDPDAFLTRAMPRLQPLFGIMGLLLWLAVVGPAVLIAGAHWPELTHNLADQVLAADNLLIMALCYPAVKIVHELGHGFAAKADGRAVRERGVLQIGRASGRERGCQNVWMSVVAVTLKKKTKN